MVVFTFSDPNERSNSFLNKIFSKRILEEKNQSVHVVNINPPTEAKLQKVLKTIVDNEKVYSLGEDVIAQIVHSSNKDLRNAVQTLQFYAAGKKPG